MKWTETVLFYEIRFLHKSIIRHDIIYMALCYSILLYGLTCWGGTNRSDINLLHIRYPKNDF